MKSLSTSTRVNDKLAEAMLLKVSVSYEDKTEITILLRSGLEN
jgi:hypothetical protein